MDTHSIFDFSKNQREKIWKSLINDLEEYYTNTSTLNVAPELNIEEIKNFVASFDINSPINAGKAIDHVMEGLSKYAVHTPHPSYYGLFNPRPTFPGIVADVITAVFNPQMAAWSHAPFASEVENYCVRELGQKLGYRREECDGVFCSGGAEANLTAVLSALTHTFPNYPNTGLRGIQESPVMYCSEEAHHSVIRAAKVTGIGLNAVRSIPVNSKNQMDPRALLLQIQNDHQNGHTPFMVIANAGSTGTGAIDPLDQIKEIADSHDLWFHVDGAYGGAVIVEPTMSDLLQGIEGSDSVTIDIHKWFSAPMGTGMVITKHSDILSQTFRIAADYMPKDAGDMMVVDPFMHSIQWSRRFIGLKFYMTLLMLGWEGLATMIRSTTKIGDYLKAQLIENKWILLTESPLPIACFTHSDHEGDGEFISFICKRILETGEAWISIYNIKDVPSLRACITNYATGSKEINKLIALLNRFEKEYLIKPTL